MFLMNNNRSLESLEKGTNIAAKEYESISNKCLRGLMKLDEGSSCADVHLIEDGPVTTGSGGAGQKLLRNKQKILF